jgi:hypothetical protein
MYLSYLLYKLDKSNFRLRQMAVLGSCCLKVLELSQGKDAIASIAQYESFKSNNKTRG